MITPSAVPAAKRRSAGGGLHTSPRHRFAISWTARTSPATQGTENCTTVLRAERISTLRISRWAATRLMRTWRNGLRISNSALVTYAFVMFIGFPTPEVSDTFEIRST